MALEDRLHELGETVDDNAVKVDTVEANKTVTEDVSIDIVDSALSHTNIAVINRRINNYFLDTVLDRVDDLDTVTGEAGKSVRIHGYTFTVRENGHSFDVEHHGNGARLNKVVRYDGVGYLAETGRTFNDNELPRKLRIAEQALHVDGLIVGLPHDAYQRVRQHKLPERSTAILYSTSKSQFKSIEHGVKQRTKEIVRGNGPPPQR